MTLLELEFVLHNISDLSDSQIILKTIAHFFLAYILFKKIQILLNIHELKRGSHTHFFKLDRRS